MSMFNAQRIARALALASADCPRCGARMMTIKRGGLPLMRCGHCVAKAKATIRKEKARYSRLSGHYNGFVEYNARKRACREAASEA